MTRAAIEIDDQEILDVLSRLAGATNHLEPALDAIGALIESSINQNFTGQHDPDGNPWEPLSPVTLSRRPGGGGQILRDTGRLNRSITHNVSDTMVEIGSNLVYANMQHFGGKKADFPWLWGDIPARPFVGYSTDDRADMMDILHRHLQRAINS